MSTGAVRDILHRVLDILLPTSCSFCRSPVGGSRIPHFCISCWSDFTVLQPPLCPVCGRPFESPSALAHSPEHTCLACRQAPPHFDQALSVGLFEGALREAVHQFKYRPCRSLGKPLGGWMAARINVVAPIDAVIPVPLHRQRLRQRGFNQALLLAHALCRRAGTKLMHDNLVRVKATRPQVELSGEERRKNVSGAFVLRQPRHVNGNHVVLVDDVFTTGATLDECSRVLKEAGASQVTALTLARAL